MPKQSLLLGALLILSAEALLAMMAGVIKHLSAELPSEQIVFFRNAVGLAVLLPIMLRNGLGSLKTDNLRWHLLRAATGLAAMYGFFYTIANLPLAEAAIVKLTTPFFLPIIAFLWLGERVSLHTRWAIPLGFLGALFIIKPGNDFSFAAIVGVGAAFLASFAKVVIRRMANSEPSTRIVFYFASICTVVTLPPALWTWQTPGAHLWPWIFALGLLGTAGQLLMTRAYQVAQPGQIGPYVYSSVLYAASIGWVFWHEVLSVTSLIGCALIIGAGLFNLSSNSKSVGLKKVPSSVGSLNSNSSNSNAHKPKSNP